MNKYFVQQRPTPPMCRSKRLRMAGVSPADAVALTRSANVYKARPTREAEVTTWVYRPGNDAAHAVLVERGPYEEAVQEGGPFYYRSYNPETYLYERHTVWRHCARWHCVADETDQVPEPGLFGWRIADLFTDLEIEVTAVPDQDGTGYTLRAIAKGGKSGEVIDPVSSIPAVCGWRMKTLPECQDGQANDVRFNKEHLSGQPPWLHMSREDLGEEKMNDGTLIFCPDSVTLTFFMRMQVGGTYSSRLRDVADDPLCDSTGDSLFTDECLYPATDPAGGYEMTEIPTTKTVEVSGAVTIEL